MDHDGLGDRPRLMVLRNLFEHRGMGGDTAMHIADRVDAQVRRQAARRRLERELHLGSRAIMPST
jgi:hypothetical protein